MTEPGPFNPAANPALYVPRIATEAALDELDRALAEGAAGVALLGPAGIGKTLMLRVLAAQLSDRYRAAYIAYPLVEIGELWRMAAVALAEGAGEEEPSLARQLAEADAPPVLLLIDDADVLPAATARAALDQAQRSNGRLFLVFAALARARASRLIRSLGDEPLEVVRLEAPMSRAETADYVETRLLREGATRSDAALFDDATLQGIHERSGGIPAQVHQEASRILAPVRQGAGLQAARLLAPEPPESEDAGLAAPPAAPRDVPPPPSPREVEVVAPPVASVRRAEPEPPREPAPTPPAALPWETPAEPGVSGSEETEPRSLWRRGPGSDSGWLIAASLAALALLGLLLVTTSEPPGGEVASDRERVVIESQPAPETPDPEPEAVAPPPLPAVAAAAAPAAGAPESEPARAQPTPPEPAVPAAKRAPASPPAAAPDPAPEPILARTRPAVAAPPPASHRVHINAQPWASIEIDGVDFGETPLGDVELSEGSHHFVARLPDGRVLERTVQVERSDLRIVFP